MLILIDTSAIISVLVSDDKSYTQDILTLTKRKRVDLVTTNEIFAELKTATKSERIKKLVQYKPVKLGRFIAWYQHNAQFIKITPNVSASILSRDQNDNKFLILAEISNADYLITLDKDLLVLKQIGRTKIVTPEKFIKSERNNF